MQCQPISANFRCSSKSLSLLRSIFACQNSVLLFGNTKNLHPSCPCQKHPFTKITVRYLRITMSGCPGSRGWFSRYLNPWAKRYLRTTSSGFVPLLCMDAIQRLRCSFVILSIYGILFRTKLQVSNEIRQLRDVCIFEMNWIDGYM